MSSLVLLGDFFVSRTPQNRIGNWYPNGVKDLQVVSNTLLIKPPNAISDTLMSLQ